MNKRKKTMRKLKNRQVNLFPGGLKKQKYNRGNPITKDVKLYRIKTFNQIRKAGGSLQDVAVKWGISPNSCGKVGWKVENYREELGIN
tara:strand:+ start:272 stop:535 length:264 start_codon:yes stop_codon:yes gene_type:complete